jgi:hypothetical protein
MEPEPESNRAVSTSSPQQPPTVTYGEDGSVKFGFRVESVSGKLKNKDKYVTPIVCTKNNWPWKLGVHFGGFGEGEGSHVSLFLEMGDYEILAGEF